jgi:hypothetical protein
MKTLISAALLLLFSPGVFAQDNHTHSAASKPVTVNLINTDGHSVGTRLPPPASKSLWTSRVSLASIPFTFTSSPNANRLISNLLALTSMRRATPTEAIAPETFPISRSFFSNGGIALIIHAVADTTTGSAPPRIACGAIVRPE